MFYVLLTYYYVLRIRITYLRLKYKFEIFTKTFLKTLDHAKRRRTRSADQIENGSTGKINSPFCEGTFSPLARVIYLLNFRLTFGISSGRMP